MLNYLWSAMILLGVLWGAVNGRMEQVTQSFVTSAEGAVSLAVTMLGIMSFWSGILEIGNGAGLTEQLAKRMRPVLAFLFPHLPAEHPAMQDMAVNMIANMFGMGWAATPAGLSAMKHLKEYNGESSTASREMCTFLIINISSLQLIPMNMIAYRSQYQSVNPAVIVGPALLATTVSTLVGVLYCKIRDR